MREKENERNTWNLTHISNQSYISEMTNKFSLQWICALKGHTPYVGSHCSKKPGLIIWINLIWVFFLPDYLLYTHFVLYSSIKTVFNKKRQFQAAGTSKVLQQHTPCSYYFSQNMPCHVAILYGRQQLQHLPYSDSVCTFFFSFSPQCGSVTLLTPLCLKPKLKMWLTVFSTCCVCPYCFSAV